MAKHAVVILAAGEGTRMKSARPKVLHGLAGRPLIRWVLSAVKKTGADKVVAVVGHGAKEVQESLAGERVVFVHQARQRGSGHALRQAAKALGGYRGDIIVLCGDTPLVGSKTLRALLAAHRRNSNAATVLTACVENPFGYGRIVRSPEGRVERIVEEKDAAPDERLIKEINSGIYCFKSPLIWDVVAQLKNSNAKREYYLTDVLLLLNERGEKVDGFSGTTPEEILGVNTRLDLAAMETIIRRRVLVGLMREGVTVIDPAATYVSPEARVGADTVLFPGVTIEGKSVIGRNCRIGPYTIVSDSVVGEGSVVTLSQVQEARLGELVKVGPFSHLRPGARLSKGSKVGNFSEVKNAVLGAGSKVNHLSYIGDAVLGTGVNVGAGTITCNFDGVRKHKTVIGDRAFVGSNVNLVAPVTVGSDVVLGAGSTITENVPARSLAIARARQVNRPRKK